MTEQLTCKQCNAPAVVQFGWPTSKGPQVALLCQQHAAERKLSELRKKRQVHRGMKVENHAYRCPHCHAWHLTSQPREPSRS